MHLEHPLYAIEVHAIGPIGFAADVIPIFESGRDGEVVFTTRIYATADDAIYMAQQWIIDNLTSGGQNDAILSD